MRNMSFALTTAQARAKTKTVTRRLKWDNAKPGDRIQQVVKGMGLKKGEKVEKIHVIEVVTVQKEPLIYMIANPRYGKQECIKEGFPTMSPRQFVKMFC